MDSVFINSVGWTLIHSLWELTALAGLFYLVLRILRNHTPQIRYYVSLLFMMISVSITCTTFILMYSKVLPASSLAEIPAMADWQMMFLVQPQEISGFWASINHFIQSSIPSLTYMYMIGVILLMLRMGINFWGLHLLKKDSLPMDWEQWDFAEDLLIKMKLSKKIHIRSSSQVQMPVVIGAFQPVILVPLAMLSDTSPHLLKAVIAHELAHIQRHDFLINILQSVVETLFFYHPAVWYFSCMVRRERELCCDQRAVEAGCDREDLARALSEVGAFHQNQQLSLQFGGSSDDLLNRVKYLLGFKPSFHFVPDHSIWYYGSLMGVFLLFSIGKNQFFPGEDSFGHLSMIVETVDTFPEKTSEKSKTVESDKETDLFTIQRDTIDLPDDVKAGQRSVFADTTVHVFRTDTIPEHRKTVVIQSDGKMKVIVDGEDVFVFDQGKMKKWRDSLQMQHFEKEYFMPDRKILDSLMAQWKFDNDIRAKTLNSYGPFLDSLRQNLSEFGALKEAFTFHIPDSLPSFNFHQGDYFDRDSLFVGRMKLLKGNLKLDSLFSFRDDQFSHIDSLIHKRNLSRIFSGHLDSLLSGFYNPMMMQDRLSELNVKSEELQQLSREIHEKEKELMELRREQQRKYREELRKRKEEGEK